MAGEREVVIWGTGSPMREFLHVDDLADAVLDVSRLNALGWTATTEVAAGVAATYSWFLSRNGVGAKAVSSQV